MKNSLLCIALAATLPSLSYAADSPYFSLKDGDGFKRFSVSVGALHVMPQGKAQPFKVNTAASEGIKSKVGEIKTSTVIENLNPDEKKTLTGNLLTFVDRLNQKLPFQILGTLPSWMSGSADVYGLSSWDNPGTGLEADDVTTFGLMSTYFFTNNIAFEMKAGIPPTVDLQGKGQIYAPFSANATPEIKIGNLPGLKLPGLAMKNDVFITDLEGGGAAASARAWTPAFEFQYHFGKQGVNKFRPYLGVGVMYAYFNELEMNPRIEQDLINAGHMIANIKNGKSGAALEGKPSSANPRVDLDATDVFAPVVTAGFTYDFTDRWFAVGSVSYAHLTNETTITVTDDKLGELIRSKADIEVNPLLLYAGVGIRF